jgi:hypothetical protein
LPGADHLRVVGTAQHRVTTLDGGQMCLARLIPAPAPRHDRGVASTTRALRVKNA